MTGGPTPLSTEQRLMRLEDENDRLAHLVEQLSARDALTGRNRDVYLAKTTTSSTYPIDPADTFEITFQDGSFPRTAGETSETYVDRSTGPLEFAKSIGGNYYDEDTIVAVLEQDGQYWIFDTDIPLQECKVKVTVNDTTCDYLAFQHYNTYEPTPGNFDTRYVSAEDLIMEHGVDLDGSPSTEKIWTFINAGNISGYSGSTDQYMGHKVGESDPTFGHDWFWYTAGHVKVSSDDLTYNYLEDQMNNLVAFATYNAATDLTIDVVTKDTGGGEEKLVYFADSSTLDFYTAADLQLAAHKKGADGGEWAWFDIVSLDNDTYSASEDLTIEITREGASNEQLRWWLPLDAPAGLSIASNEMLAHPGGQGYKWFSFVDEATYASSADQQLHVEFQAAAIQIFLKQDAIPGHDVTKKQQFIHAISGDMQWEDVVAVTDTCQVKVSSNDVSCEYLIDQMKDTSKTYQTSDDLLIHVNEQNDGGDESVRIFAPYDLVTNWTDLNNQLMAKVASGGFVFWDLANEGSYDASQDQFISVQLSAGVLTWFIDQSAIPAHVAGNKQHIIHAENGDIQWEDTETATDTCQVKVSAADTTCGYLFDKLKDTSKTFNPSDDLMIHGDITDAAADENVRLFAPYDLVTNWTDGNNQILSKVASGGFVYWDLANQGSYTAGEDQEISVQLSASQLTFYLDQRLIPGHSLTEEQMLIHGASVGDIQWKDTSLVTDACKVLVSSADTGSCEFLFDQMKDTSTTFRSNDDLMIHANITSPAGDESVRYFAPYDLVTNWTDAKNQLMAKVGNGGFVYWDLGNQATYSKFNDQFISVQLSGSELTWFLKQDAIPNHFPGEDQWLIHNKFSGDIEWRTITTQASQDKFVAVNGDTPGFLESKKADVSVSGFTPIEDILVSTTVIAHPTSPGNNAIRDFVDSSTIPGFKKSVGFANLQFLGIHHNAEGVSWHDTADQTSSNFAPGEDFIIDVDVQFGFVRWYFDVHRAVNYNLFLPQVLGHGLVGGANSRGPTWSSLQFVRVQVDTNFIPATSTTPARFEKTFLDIPLTEFAQFPFKQTIVEYEECP